MSIPGIMKPWYTLLVLFSCLFFITVSTNAKTIHQPGYKQGECQTPACLRQAETILFAMDKDLDPCDDFFKYTCNGYNKKSTIPDDLTTFDHFESLKLKLLNSLKEVMENIEDNGYKPFELVANSYKACMDEASIEKKNGQPLLNVLKDVLGGWPVLIGRKWNKTNFDPMLKSADMRHHNLASLFLLDAGANYLNNSENILFIDQPETGLLRAFLVKDDYTTQREAYSKLMIDIAELLQGKKLTSAQLKEIKEILPFERELASITKAPEDRKDVPKRYRKMPLKQANKEIGNEISLKKIFNRYLKGVTRVNCTENIILGGDVQFYHDLKQLLKKTNIRTVANYLGWRLALEYLPYLSSNFRQVKKKFDNVIQGETVEQARWRTCIDNVNGNLAFATGKLYVDAHFNEGSKEITFDIASRIKDTLQEILEANDWMDKETKEKALLKLHVTKVKVGYQDSYSNTAELEKEYKDLTASVDDHFQNNVNFVKFSALKGVKELSQPVDKERWPTGPAVINAFNSYKENTLYLLAAFLQPPIFEADRPRFVNYGSMGMVTGHEFSHSFDDTGKAFDQEGNLLDWWSESSSKKFIDKSKCFIDQFDKYFVPEVNLTVNGRNTLGENIADFTGLKVAYKTFKKVQKELGDEPGLPGLTSFTPDQLFFLSFATVWCQVSRVEAIRFQVLSDVHSPHQFRVNGALENLPEFLDAFNCPKNSRMASTNVCKVW